MLLAGDVGGTKTILAIFEMRDGRPVSVAEATFASARYASLEAVVRAFLADVSLPVERASFGVAGPVYGHQADITNLSWALVDVVRLAETFGWTAARLLNDLEAIAYAVPHLGPADLHTLQVGTPVAGGALGVVAPGTGLGEAFLTWDGARYRAFPSEGGNVDFAPTDAQQIALLQFVQRQYEQVHYELVCSGIGIPNLYAFLKETGDAPEPAWLAAQLDAAPDPTPVIVAAALDQVRPSELCRATMDLFVAILGAETGNLALKVMATGGVYLGGGIPPRILPLLQQPRFLRAFCRKAPLAHIVEAMPVHVIRNPNVALLGAAYAGFEMQTTNT